MKTTIFFLSALGFVGSLFATDEIAQKSSGKQDVGQAQQGQMNQQQMMMNAPDCAQLTPTEQNFANQINDVNSKMMFCTQFTQQQRRQAMQMMGTTGASGNMMTADEAVQQVMQNNGGMPQRSRSSGGCPVK
jgi:hypothetical protein